MNRDRENFKKHGEPPSESWLFAQELLGNPLPTRPSPTRGQDDLAELRWLATISPRHADELRQLESTAAEKARIRQSLIWAAQISPEAEAKLRDLLREEAQAEQSRWPGTAAESSAIYEWNPNQRRRPKGSSGGGQWAPDDGGGTTGSILGVGPAATGEIDANPSDPSKWYLPSDSKGEWKGAKGNSSFRLKTPIEANGKLIGEIEFKHGVPELTPFALPGKTATIVLTGDHGTDVRNAEQAWRNLHPGEEIPKKFTFHHDLLNATEQTVEIDGKKIKVLVGQMQLIPTKANEAVFHQGSASVAKKYYRGLGVDMTVVAKLAKEEAQLAAKTGSLVHRASKKITSGTIAKGLLPLVGRNIVRVIPIIGAGLAILEFAENAEAHGVGGAVARATPVLGDLIAAADLGSELAKTIRDDADTKAWYSLQTLNKPSRDAWDQADSQTIAAYTDLAPQIQVTNPPRSDENVGLVDAREVVAALHEYREAMQNANLRRNIGMRGFDFKAAAAQNKDQLRRRLQRASQYRGNMHRGPIG